MEAFFFFRTFFCWALGSKAWRLGRIGHMNQLGSDDGPHGPQTLYRKTLNT